MDEVRKHCRAKIPEYMVPGDVVFLDALPKTTSGKINRKKVAELVAPKLDS